MSHKVLVTDYAWPTLDIEREVLADVGAELVVAETGDEAELAHLAASHDVAAILTCWKNVSAKVLDAAPSCRTVARYGVGVDNIDVERADELGMLVTRVPDYCVAEVAEHTLALLLSAARGVTALDRAIRSGVWDNKVSGPLHRLAGQTLGLIGVGNIGRAVGQRASALGLDVIGYHPTRTGTTPDGIQLLANLHDVLNRSDHVSLHVPLTADTAGIIDAAALAAMKPTAYLVNTARGALIDEQALRDAVVTGRIAGAALDVLSIEPAPLDHPLVNLDRVIVTPHAAFYSVESIEDLEMKSARNVADVLGGRRPPDAYLVNPAVLDRPASRVQLDAA